MTISDLDGVYSMNNCIECIGYIDQKELLNYYLEVDALLFLSLEESYGLPLIEAMYFNLPIIVPDLEYARYLCGDRYLF